MTNFLKLIEHIQQEHKNYLSIYVFVMWIKEHFNYLSKEKNKKKTNKQRYYFGSNNVLVAAKNVACCFYWCLGSHGMGWLFGATYRSKMRRLFSLPEEPYSDLFVHACCCVCSLTQEYKELKNRGVDPSIGTYVNSPLIKSNWLIYMI